MIIQGGEILFSLVWAPARWQPTDERDVDQKADELFLDKAEDCHTKLSSLMQYGHSPGRRKRNYVVNAIGK